LSRQDAVLAEPTVSERLFPEFWASMNVVP